MSKNNLNLFYPDLDVILLMNAFWFRSSAQLQALHILNAKYFWL